MRSIFGKMLGRFGITLAAVVLVIGGVLYVETRGIVVPLTQELSQDVLEARADDMARLLGSYVQDVRALAAREPVRTGRVEAIDAVLREAMREVDAADFEMLFYADREGRFLTTGGQTGSVADRAYFKAIIEGGAPDFISDPLVSRSSGEHVFVVACPVTNQDGHILGLIGATVLLERFSGIASAIEIGHSGFGYVVGADGLLIAHPSETWRLKLNLLESAKEGFRNLDQVGRMMIDGTPGFVTYRRPDGERFVTVFHAIPRSPGWTLGIALHEDQLLGPAHRLMRIVAILLVGLLVAVLIVVALVSRGLAAPIRKLVEGVRYVATGHLDRPIALPTGDELETLADAFNRMQRDLKAHVEDLVRTTAEKERIERDLQVANKIQTSMLPRIFPPFPDIKNLDLFATMEPAREVGGDFYDFFLIDEHRLCFSIGDVSGKGVGAALFMVIARTVLKNQALTGAPVAEIMRRSNELLCADNEESMFATVFLGVLNLQTGQVDYVSAGHNPPLIARSGQPFALLTVKPCVVLGGIEGSAYTSSSVTLAPGDLLFLYTDGITEGMNAAGDMFGEQRMLAATDAAHPRGAQALIRAVREALTAFVGVTPASDDVTMLALGLRN